MSTQTESVTLDVEYLKSRPGLLRIGEALIGLCGIISVSQGECFGFYAGLFGFYNFVVVTTLVLALIVLILYSFGLAKFCPFINCFLSVFINDVLFAILYLIATILMIVAIGKCGTYGQVARIFAMLFGVCGTVVVGLLAMLGYQAMRENTQSTPKSDPA